MVKYAQRAALAGAALLFFSGCVQSQAPIVDAGSPQRGNTSVPAAAPASAGLELLLGRIQALEGEVMQLRGIVEEQSYQIETLKQQSLERYIELDKRLGGAATSSAGMPSENGSGVARAGPTQPLDAWATPAASAQAGSASAGDGEPEATTPGTTAPESVASPGAAVVGNQSDMDAYRDAYSRVKSQDFAGAIAAFQAFLQSYPDSSLIPNAHYWLGELYLQSPQDLAAAQKSFDLVLKEYPEHNKAPDALYKLGRIAHMQGEEARAEELLQRVIDEYGASGSAAPQLAKQFIDQNFR